MHQKMMYLIKALVVLYLLLAWITTAYQQQQQQSQNLSEMKPNSDKSSIALPLTGNVYPLGYYAVSILIGKKRYVLDIDTGSDLTWTNCDSTEHDALKHNARSPFSKGYVTCNDPDCIALGDLRRQESCTKQCYYEVHYADGVSSTGFLGTDLVPLQLRNGKWVIPRLTFGCAEPQVLQLRRDGMLGLGKGKSGFLSQLHKLGLIDNVVGHCLSSRQGGGGYMYFGDIPFFGIVWKQLERSDERYNLGQANILFSDEPTDIRKLRIIFDSGSTYTYLNSHAYGALLDLITRHLSLKRTRNDQTLPMCWKGGEPFKTVSEVVRYFKNLALIFPFGGNVKFQMPPASYLIISNKGNVCLAILNGTEIGLKHKNVIGDISMHDKVVIYDNNNAKVGWAEANCNRKKS